ncbi:DgyrCDS5835 [Dimorphilus gyrociliatus]|nr:DgyrCDS5835 [Dimorphilus gyrociliatus]
MLDVELQRSIDYTCNHDHLDYALLDKNHTVPLCSYPRTENSSNTESSSLILNFRSDGESENRGFWLRYSALTTGNKPGKVTVKCRKLPFTETNEPYTPSHLKRKSKQCLEEKNGEIFLGCKQGTIINIKSAHHYRSDNCTIENEIPACSGNFEQMDKFKKTCMGKYSCTFHTKSKFLSKCEADSNMILVDYECIPDRSSHQNVIDICGESTSAKEIRRSHGYLKSLSYPDDYPIDIKCSCNLSVGPDEQILFNLIDLGMQKSCSPDLIEYSVSNSKWGLGVHLCNMSERAKIHTGLSTLSLNFNSGNDKLSRGFWLQYEGITKLGGKSTVSIKCFVIKGSNDPDATKKPNEEVRIEKITTSNGNKTAMIAGILVVLLLICMIITVIIAHQFRRRKLLWKQSHFETPVYSIPSRSERTLCTLRSVPSTYPSPYSTYTNTAYNENLFIKKNIEEEEDSNYVKM